MASAAAERCLEAIDADREVIDLVTVATMTPDCPTPSTACQVQQRLGLRAAAKRIAMEKSNVVIACFFAAH